MYILMFETCWANISEIKTTSDIKLVFNSSTIAMMHGPINIRSFYTPPSYRHRPSDGAQLHFHLLRCLYFLYVDNGERRPAICLPPSFKRALSLPYLLSLSFIILFKYRIYLTPNLHFLPYVITQCLSPDSSQEFKLWCCSRVSASFFTAPWLTLIPLTCRIWWAPNNASRWQMGFNSAFKGLIYIQKGWC